MLLRHLFSVTVLTRVARCVSVPSFVLQVNVVDVALGTHKLADKFTHTNTVGAVAVMEELAARADTAVFYIYYIIN